MQEYWSGLPCRGDLPNPGIKPTSLMSPELAGRFFTSGKPIECTYKSNKQPNPKKKNHQAKYNIPTYPQRQFILIDPVTHSGFLRNNKVISLSYYSFSI